MRLGHRSPLSGGFRWIGHDDGNLIRTEIKWLPRDLRLAATDPFVVLLLLFLMFLTGREDIVKHVHQTGMTGTGFTVALQSHKEAHNPIVRRLSDLCTAVYTWLPYSGSRKKMGVPIIVVLMAADEPKEVKIPTRG